MIDRGAIHARAALLPVAVVGGLLGQSAQLTTDGPLISNSICGGEGCELTSLDVKRAGLARTIGHTGAVTLIQRFSSALNPNIHFHMLFLDGVYLIDDARQTPFRQGPHPGPHDLQILVEHIAEHIGRALEKRGLIERYTGNDWHAEHGKGGPLDDPLGHSITYHIAVGPRAGQKLSTLHTVPARTPESLDEFNSAGNSSACSAT